MGQYRGKIEKKLWDTPPAIKLINMNHNRYPSSCKNLRKKWR